MDLLKKRSFKSGLKKVFSLVMMAALVFGILGTKPFTEKAEASSSVTITFVDNTPQKWIGNDSAVMELVDNTYGHVSYRMTKTGSYTWSVTVPSSANNITFNRYNSSMTTKWNSFSAGGRNGCCTYRADGHEYGSWVCCNQIPTQTGFRTGDVVYLDTSAFTAWENDNAIFYINFTNATKSQNNGNDVYIPSANRNLYQPRTVQKCEEHMYSYTVTSADEGKTVLRFWRGNYNTLWNCSIAFTYDDYKAGYNCIKVTGWDDSGYKYRR